MESLLEVPAQLIFCPLFLTARGRASMSGPRRFAPLTRVGHDTRPHSCGLSEGGNEPNRNERNLSWHALQPQQLTNPKRQPSKLGTSPAKAITASGPKSEPHGPIATAKGFRCNSQSSRSAAKSSCANHFPSRENQSGRVMTRPESPSMRVKFLSNPGNYFRV